MIRRNNTLRRQIEIDENEIKSLHEDSKSFALKSLKNYSLCMQTGVGLYCSLACVLRDGDIVLHIA